MTPAELREARAKLGLSAARLATALEMGAHGGRTVRRWEAGAPIPGMAAVAVGLMLEKHTQKCDVYHNGSDE